MRNTNHTVLKVLNPLLHIIKNLKTQGIVATYSMLFTKYTSLLISTGHMRIVEQQLKTNTHNGHCNLI